MFPEHKEEKLPCNADNKNLTKRVKKENINLSNEYRCKNSK